MRQSMQRVSLQWPILLSAVLLLILLAAATSDKANGSTANDNKISQQVISTPRLLLLDEKSLQHIKTYFSSGKQQSVLLHLYGQADAYAAMPTLSVTQNNGVPASGKSRDYFSVGPYWWPNPNTPNGLPWINRDGEVNRAVRGANSDSKLFDALSERVYTLALAYYLSGNNTYAKAVQSNLDSWFLDNSLGMTPHLNFAQAVPGKASGRGIGIIEFRKILAILDAITLVNHTLDDSTRENLDTWFSVFLGWLIESENGVDEAQMHNNHGTFYDVITTGIALHLGMDELAQALLKQASQRATIQIDQQGAQAHELDRTKPFHYSVFNLHAFAQLTNMARIAQSAYFSVDSNEAQRLVRAHDYLVDNLYTSTIWPGPQEKTLPVQRLISTSLLLQKHNSSVFAKSQQLTEMSDLAQYTANCRLWMLADTAPVGAMLNQTSDELNRIEQLIPFTFNSCDILF